MGECYMHISKTEINCIMKHGIRMASLSWKLCLSPLSALGILAYKNVFYLQEMVYDRTISMDLLHTLQKNVGCLGAWGMTTRITILPARSLSLFLFASINTYSVFSIRSSSVLYLSMKCSRVIPEKLEQLYCVPKLVSLSTLFNWFSDSNAKIYHWYTVTVHKFEHPNTARPNLTNI